MVVKALQITGKVKNLMNKLRQIDDRSFEYYKRSALSEAAALEEVKQGG